MRDQIAAFAIPRMEPGTQRPIQSMEEARDWERLFIGETRAGRDPRRAANRSIQSARRSATSRLSSTRLGTLCEAGWPSQPRLGAQPKAVLKEHLGHLPLAAIEDPDPINRFKTESDYAEDVELASVHRVLERLRATINWGLAQTPPLFARSPFHRFGVRLNKKAETVRDRRVSREEEKRLLGFGARRDALRYLRSKATYHSAVQSAALQTPGRKRT